MISFELTEPTFSKKKTSDYELSVLLGADSLSYCITDNNRLVLSVVKEDLPEAKEGETYPTRVENLILRNTLLQQTYRRVSFAIFNTLSTFIPERLYDKAQQNVYIERMLRLPEGAETHQDKVAGIKAHNVYATEKGLMPVLKTYFSGATIRHIVTPLTAALRRRSLLDAEQEKTVFLNVNSECLQIFLFNAGELLFCNTFSYSSSKDFIYYVMLVYDQFGLKPGDVPVVLSGDILTDSEIYHLIYRYIKQVKLIETPENISLSGQWVNRPAHRFFDLFTLGAVDG